MKNFISDQIGKNLDTGQKKKKEQNSNIRAEVINHEVEVQREH